MGSCRRHIESLIDIDGDVNCLGLENGTALDYFLCNKNHVSIYNSKYRELLETLIFENSEIEINSTAVQHAFSTDLEIQMAKHSRLFSIKYMSINGNIIDQGKFKVDGKQHGLFGDTEGEMSGLNFTAPLLIECGYIVNGQPFMKVLILWKKFRPLLVEI